MKVAKGRRSTRLPRYNYERSGAFYVTICSHRRGTGFGEVMDDTVSLSPLGRIVAKTWEEIPLHFPNAEPLAFVVMPNHVHGVILLSREGGVPPTIPVVGDFQPRGIQIMIRNYKAAVTSAASRDGHVGPVWQRGYYDRILRDEDEIRRACEYIALNPSRWSLDKENPVHGTG